MNSESAVQLRWDWYTNKPRVLYYNEGCWRSQSLKWPKNSSVLNTHTHRRREHADPPPHRTTNPLILQKSSMRWRRGNKTSLSVLVSASLDMLMPVLMPGAILWTSHEALWFVYTNILSTQPDSAERVQTQRNQRTALSSEQIWICISTVHWQKHRHSHYTQECAGTHTYTHITPYTSLTGTLNRPHSDLPACLAASTAAESS